MIILEVKFKPNTNGVRKEIANHGNSENAAFLEILAEASLVTYTRRAVVTKRSTIPQRKGCQQNASHERDSQRHFRYFRTSKVQKIKCWKLIQT